MAGGLHFPSAPGRGGGRAARPGPAGPAGSMAAREAGGVVLGKSADKLFSLSGLFAVYKPKGPTSAGVLNLLKERLLAEAGVQTNGNKRNQVLKIGHGGTLDSAAAGVLVVGIGKGTKMLRTMLAGSKVEWVEGSVVVSSCCQCSCSDL
uniref:tRNA pseudouridine(55) synthase n=1 Tax=Otus sunia TaxID=257818 RepID=A0A8C8BMY8_9STRI